MGHYKSAQGDTFAECKMRKKVDDQSPSHKCSQEEQQSGEGQPMRKLQVYLVAASRLMCYFTRAQLGQVLPFVIKDLNLAAADQGSLMSRYASGYLLTQILGGALADRLGGGVVTAAVILATSVCCLLVPLIATFDAQLLGWPFFVMGFFQGMVMPAGQVLMARWILPSERSWASSITGIGASMGTLIITLIAAPIASRAGWQAVFWSSSFACILLLILWIVLAASSPDECTRLSDGERRLLDDAGLLRKGKVGSNSGASKSSISSKLLLFQHPSVWTVCYCGFTQNCQVYFAEWLPMLYNRYLGVSPDQAGFLLSLTAIVELPARAVTKDIPEKYAKGGMTLLQSRRWMSWQGFGYHSLLCLTLYMLMLSEVKSSFICTGIFALSRISQSFHSGGYFANYMDLTTDNVGMLTGVGNTLASFAGVVVPRFVASQLSQEKDNWPIIMLVGALANFSAIFSIHKFMSTQCLDKASPSSVVGICADEKSMGS